MSDQYEIKPLKTLVSAYACAPSLGSEPGVGWNWVRQIARFSEVWVITRENNRETIEASLAQTPMPGVHWIYFDLPLWARFWKKGRRGIHLYYYLWQVGIYHLAKKLHLEIKFDLIHHVTFVNYWMPSFLGLLPIPFIWGPVGGGDSTPPNFYGTYSLNGRIFELARGLALRVGERDPFVRMTARSSRIALATTSQTASRLEGLGCRDVRLLSQVALPEEEICILSSLSPSTGKPFRFVSVGQLLHLKGFHLGLMAFANLSREILDCEYWVIGGGPERKRLERLAGELGIADRVRFLGSLPRGEALHRLADCDALIHPSLHDSGGWVIAEAMAVGRPVICLDWGGPSLQVIAETGFKIHPQTPEQTIAMLSRAMIQLARSPDLCAQMGKAAQKRVAEHFNWDGRGYQIRRLYTEALHRRHDLYNES